MGETVSHVHVNRLTEYSAPFRIAFTPQWKDNLKSEMRLPEEEPKTFEQLFSSSTFKSINSVKSQRSESQERWSRCTYTF